jgi:phosphatidylglycerol:prolipoprotein diacylglycerol transferase
MIATILFPEIDPIAIELGPFAIRWYAIAYIVGLLIGWRYTRRMAATTGTISEQAIDDFLLWATLGVILGGRIGYILFYQPAYYIANPVEVVYIWRGGMSFHGGLLGVVVAIVLFARSIKVPVMALSDVVAAAAPIGLFFGRIANFVNAELYGRPTDLPWGVLFPGEALPRHPSQLYEAALEGLVLFVILFVLARRGALQRPGLITGVFLFGYAASRFLVEFVREPDAHLGYLLGGATMGQLLSIPMALLGLAILVWSRRASN